MKTRPAEVLISEWMDEAGLDLLARRGLRVHYDPDLHRRRAELEEHLAAASGLIVRNATRVDRRLLAAAPGLRVVGRLGCGLDNIDRASLAGAGVVLTYSPDAHTAAVAEFTLAALFVLARQLVTLHGQVVAGRWPREPMGFQLQGRRLGILGLGRIGLAVAQRARPLGLHVVSWHPRRRAHDPLVREAGVSLLPYAELLATAHVLTLHLPLTGETRELLDEDAFAGMRQGIWLINASRGGIIDEAALAAALARGRVAGAALDVRRREPPGPDDPLEPYRDRLLLTPHVAAMTPEAQRQTALTVALDVSRCLQGAPPHHPAPPPNPA